MGDAPLQGMRNIPYEPRLHPRTQLPVLYTLTAAILALLLFVLLRS